MNLLAQVVESLERASRQAPGATKLYNICKILLKGARSCIEQSLSTKPTATTRQMQTQDKKTLDYKQEAAQNDESAQFGFREDWDPVQLDHLSNMSTLFDNYLAGNSSLIPILDADLTQLDMMESSSNVY